MNRVTGKELPGSELDVSLIYDLEDHLLGAAASSQPITLARRRKKWQRDGPLQTVYRQFDAAGRHHRKILRRFPRNSDGRARHAPPTVTVIRLGATPEVRGFGRSKLPDLGVLRVGIGGGFTPAAR